MLKRIMCWSCTAAKNMQRVPQIYLSRECLSVRSQCQHELELFTRNFLPGLKWGFLKIRGTFLGVPIIRTLVCLGLYWGPLFWETTKSPMPGWEKVTTMRARKFERSRGMDASKQAHTHPVDTPDPCKAFRTKTLPKETKLLKPTPLHHKSPDSETPKFTHNPKTRNHRRF